MLIKNLFKPLLPLVLAALAAGAHTAHAGEVEDAIADKLTAAIPGLKISDVRKSEAEGLYEVYSNNGDTILDRKSTRLNSSHPSSSRMPSSA